MVMTCEQVRREISDYLDGEVNANLHATMEEHLRECQACRAILDGTRNVIRLFGEERMFEPPTGFSQRLRQRLEQNMPRKRRGPAFGWMVALAAAALVVFSFQVGSSTAFVSPALRSELAQPGKGIPAELTVVVSDEGKLFHLPACTFIHDKTKLRTLTASEAQKEGYTPCVRCLKKYLTETAVAGKEADIDEVAGTPASAEE